MKIRRRLILHFSIQFISIAALMIFTIFLTALIVIGFYTKDISEYNYYQAKLEEVSINSGDSFKEIEMPVGWDESFKEENIWVQIVNVEGDVIESGNAPSNVPSSYSYNDLGKLKDTKRLQNYSLAFYLDTFYENPYLFILGYQDDAVNLLNRIVEIYGENGDLSEENIAVVERLIQKQQGTLEIYNGDYDLLHTIGRQNDEKENPLDVFVRDVAPDTYSMKRTTYEDAKTGSTWVLYTVNEKHNEIKLESYLDIFKGFAVIGAIVLVITILISIWNGFRYGNPLFIFANWLERMGSEKYAEVLTDKERKRIYRKNGKIRLRYRLYKEVFSAFYEMAEKLDASRKERERLEKTRDEWMTGISHDLRTPLTTIQGYGNILESGKYDWSKGELEDFGKVIREKSDYMLHLIEDFSLSFQMKNKVHVQFEKVEVNRYLESILEKYNRDHILKEYSFTLIPLQQTRVMNMNKRLFERMMDNLIYNAIKHNPSGTSISVIVAENENNQGLKIIVKDNGIGIEESIKVRLFDRYYRGTNTDERLEGTGLGMAIAMQIAQLHEGKITVESERNVGTEVCVEFPDCIIE